ncbi:MAG TPA: hypothetical protein VEK07_07450 [Polyangiaceae bacterium]|nr:hypothetical protein [Polyangiaceae bacterium]
MHFARGARPLLAAALIAALAACFPDSDVPSDAGSTALSSGGSASGATVTVTIATDAGAPISTTAFGQNYWDWVDWSGDGVTGLSGTQPLVGQLGLGVIRAGGDNNDWNSPSPFDMSQIDAFVAYCRAVGAEPILQVPLVADVDGGPATAQTAAAMMTYANVTQGYGIRYWEIGNEPDIYPTDFDASFPIQTAADYCNAFDNYVTAMKAANAAGPDGGTPIMFLGPELAYKYVAGDDWLTPFLDGCKDDVDIVTIHRYPFSGAQTSLTGALDDVTMFRSTVSAVSAIVQGHARPGTPLGITEANLSYSYALSAYNSASLQAAPGTYPAALWTADVMGAALESGLWTLAFWNIGEVSSSTSVLGFIVADSPVPAYYAEQLVTSSFRGSVLAPAGVPTGFSVYAGHDPSQASTAVLVLNKTTASSSLALAVGATPPQTFEYPPLSITLVEVPDSPGAQTHVIQYTGDQAEAGAAPQMIQ